MSSTDNVSTRNQELLPQADLEAQLQASPSPMTDAKDASSWLEAKEWILASKKYTKPKLADILLTVALTQKHPSDTCAAMRVVAFLIKALANQDLLDSIASLITNKVTLQISSSIDNLATEFATTKGFLDAVVHQRAKATVALKESV